jgi:HK97 family phage major capsid protein
MPSYDKVINKNNLAPSQLPVQTLDGILKEATKQSVILQRARTLRMAAGTAKQSILASLPEGYWVDNSNLSTAGGQPGLKETTDIQWADKSITAEEMAVIVPIPDVVQDDANFNITSEVVPLVAEAFARVLDKAAIFGVNRPSSFDTDIVTAATTAGNTVARTATTDLGQSVAKAGQLLSEQGFAINGFMSKPGINWELVGLRDTTGQPIYTPLQGQFGSNLYGYPLDEVTNGAWDSSVVDLIAADWNRFVVGIRQDVTYKVFEEGVITDASGNVVYNLMQQDSKAIRFVFRVGFATMVPVSPLASDRYPAALITPAGSGD